MTKTIIHYLQTIKKILPIAIIAIAITHVASQLIIGDATDGFIHDFFSRFNVDSEVSVPTWYSICLLLLLSAAAFYQAHLVKIHQGYWKILSVIFLLMSMDEGSSFHEIIVWPIKSLLSINGPSLFHNAWIIVGVLFVIAGAIALRSFLQIIDKKSRKLLVAGFICYVMGIIVLESIGGLFVESNPFINKTFIVLVEELFEIAGLSLVANAIFNEIENN